MRSIKKLTLTSHVVNYCCHEGKTSRMNVIILSFAQLMLRNRCQAWVIMGRWCRTRENMGRVPSAGKLMQGNSASEWWAFSEALEYVVHTLSNEKWFPSKYHGSLWEVGWSGPWWLSILCCGLELLKINNINEIIELLKMVKGSHSK